MEKSITIPLRNISLIDGFLGDRTRLAVARVIPYQWLALNDEISAAEPSHAIENFHIAAGESSGEFHGMVFRDSDVAKWREAAAYALTVQPDPVLQERVDFLVGLAARGWFLWNIVWKTT
ncbi:MAG: glycoside hydrolase family 127 protein [Spirochaetales bacterium]|nr:glycoside hydrolase family 127 protein [Spirochaetales bacterium]